MAKFRKLPVLVDAVQWFKPGDHPAVEMREPTPMPGDRATPIIRTLEGPMIVRVGDWIITGVKGEHYPCKPDIFDVTYEAVAG